MCVSKAWDQVASAPNILQVIELLHLADIKEVHYSLAELIADGLSKDLYRSRTE